MISILDSWRPKRRIHKTHHELYGLGDRTRSDISLARADFASSGRGWHAQSARSLRVLS